MTTQVSVRTAEVSIRTVALSKSLLKQIVKCGYQEIQSRLNRKMENTDVIGWLSGSLFGDDWKSYLLVHIGDGDYRLVEGGMHPEREYKQVYVA